jgi:hypothetical protein
MRNDAGYKRERSLNLSGLANSVFTLLICIACWGIGYYYTIGYPVQSGVDSSFLWNAICRILPAGINHLYIMGFFLLCLGAAFLQRFNFLFVIIKEKTTLPFLLFLLLNSVNPGFYPIRPISFALFLLLLAMFELYGSYQNPKAISRMFNVMVYLSAGSLVWPNLLWFVPVFGIGMYKFRILNRHTFASSMLGFFTTIWFVLGWSVWKHDFAVFENFVQCITDIRIIFSQESWLMEWLAPLCVFIFMIGAYIHISLRKHENTIRSRNFLSLLLIFGIVSFVLSLCYASSLDDFLCVFYLSASLILSYFLSGKYGFVAFLLYYLPAMLFILLLLVRLWNF